MIAVVVIEAIAIAFLGLLVAGLLRSHAEILRQLHAQSGGGEQYPDLHVSPGVVLPREDAPPAFDISGETPGGEAVAISVTGGEESTLLAFLSSGCVTCQRFWDDFQRGQDLGLPQDIGLVIVTKGPDEESVSRVRSLATGKVPVVMSTRAWGDYEVPGAPYFILVAGPSGLVAGEGSAGAWPEVRSFIGQALADARSASVQGDRDRADAELFAAGIGPGHPSLYGADSVAEDAEVSPTAPDTP